VYDDAGVAGTVDVIVGDFDEVLDAGAQAVAGNFRVELVVAVDLFGPHDFTPMPVREHEVRNTGATSPRLPVNDPSRRFRRMCGELEDLLAHILGGKVLD